MEKEGKQVNLDDFMELISQYEWAKRRGFSKQYVSQLIKSGKIPLEQGKINPAKADAIMAATRDPGKVTKRYNTGHTEDLSDLLLRTRIKNEVQRGKLLETRNRLESEELVSVEEVKKAAFNKARVVRDGLLNIPDRVVPLLCSITDQKEMHRILMAEIKEVLSKLAS